MDMRFGKRWRRSLGARLLATYLVGLLVSVLVISSAVLLKLNFATDAMAEHALEGQARWLERGLRFDASGRPVGVTGDADRLQWVFDALPDDLKYRVLDAEGRVLLSSDADDQATGGRGPAVRRAAPAVRDRLWATAVRCR